MDKNNDKFFDEYLKETEKIIKNLLNDENYVNIDIKTMNNLELENERLRKQNNDFKTRLENAREVLLGCQDAIDTLNNISRYGDDSTVNKDQKMINCESNLKAVRKQLCELKNELGLTFSQAEKNECNKSGALIDYKTNIKKRNKKNVSFK